MSVRWTKTVSEVEREFAAWVREKGPDHLRGANPRFDVTDAALRYYADMLGAAAGAYVIAKRGPFPRERDAPSVYMLERRDYIVKFVQNFNTALPAPLICVVSPLCRIAHFRRFTGVMIDVSVGMGGYYVLVDLEEQT
jgi:hypothetical protein